MDDSLILLKRLLSMEPTDISKDDILIHYLNKARSNIYGYCNVATLPMEYDDVIVDYAVYLYQNRDSVGLANKQEGERSATYETGIPISTRLALPLPKIKIGAD
ncbi:phage head-tail connector protein [Paenibacillus polymyxa]|uniref:phage head-tail connector protein n=1 Tax=Paenibacillus polymyxa TaxID=1406 RepID=UPI00298C3B98|nr:phage head-tail connector protein [Paenibacillus polymyxa]MEE4571043.1 phage head-tail connector protein [Paenibacillus polymyxa]